MQQPSEHYKPGLLPLSWLYGCGVYVRNKLFDWDIFKQTTFANTPIICVGNISVGGTGKTPHIEYLIRLLQERYKVAVISRGYKRKTTGFVLASESSTPEEIGDEPCQIKMKFPSVTIAVDGNRKRGIEKLLALPEEDRPDIILMDDGFQHRWVKPSLSIILSDNNNPVYEDKLLPAGRLREALSSLQRASVVLATKCSPDMRPIDMRITMNSFGLFPYQSLMFTCMKYGKLTPVNSNNKTLDLHEIVGRTLILVTGIAHPEPLQRKLAEFSSTIMHIELPDHHDFGNADIETIQELLADLPDDSAFVITTEKDIVKLRGMNLPEEIEKVLYYLPIEVEFLNEEEKLSFNKKILNHVRKNSRNSRIHKK